LNADRKDGIGNANAGAASPFKGIFKHSLVRKRFCTEFWNAQFSAEL